MRNETKLKSCAACTVAFLISALMVGGCDKQEEKQGTPDGGVETNATECVVAAPSGEKDKVVKTSKANAMPFVAGFDPTELRGFELQFSDMPDLNRLMDFVKIVPSPGPVTTDWWSWSKTVAIRGDFAAHTTYQVTV